MTDPSYGGKLTYVNNKLRLEARVDFDEADMPQGVATFSAVRYQIHKVPTGSVAPLQSPDGLMTLVPTANTFLNETYVIIIEGYNGWPRTGTEFQQYFLHAGLVTARRTSNTLGEFSLKFSVADPEWAATNLRLCHRPGSDEGTPLDPDRPVNAISKENAVEVKGLDTLGYYGLMQE